MLRLRGANYTISVSTELLHCIVFFSALLRGAEFFYVYDGDSNTVYVEDPPSADPNATQEKYVEPNTQNGIFAFLNQQSVTLYPVE